MKNTMNLPALPSLTEKVLSDPLMPVDNLLSTLWKTLGMKTLLNRAGFKKRSGIEISPLVYLLLIWKLTRKQSIHFFSKDSLQSFGGTHKDTLYDFLKREDVNWRRFHSQVAKKVYSEKLKDSEIKAFVADDTVKSRRGKKMEGVSRHFDHLTKRTISGQQILTLGMATEGGFIPIEQEIFISQKQIQPATFKDGRHHAAKRYQESLKQTKPRLLESAVKRAINNGFEADYFLADAWFGNKSTLLMTERCGLTAVLRMRKNKTRYRVTEVINGKKKVLMLNAAEIYKRFIRKNWDKVEKTQLKHFDVELNLAQTKKDDTQWIKVRLLFVRGVKEEDQATASPKNWALFLATDVSLSPLKILEIYALRWGIEVYFKEAKQHLGFLEEQTIHFSSHLASLSLTAVRYILLLYAALESGARVCDMREKMGAGLQYLNFAQQLWVVFQSLITESLKSSNLSFDDIISTLDKDIKQFFIQAMQITENSFADP